MLKQLNGTIKKGIDIECIILGTDPTLIDSDNNNINDFDEDTDNDELSNGLEVSYGTDLVSPDTDFDGLADGEEINGVLYTDPAFITNKKNYIRDKTIMYSIYGGKSIFFVFPNEHSDPFGYK